MMLSLGGACIKLHSLPLDMFSFFSNGHLWLSRNRVHHLSFLTLHAEHLKMHQAESVGNTDNQGRIIEPMESDTENEYTMEDDIVVKTPEGLGSRINDANTAFDVDFERDKREHKVSLTLKN